MQAPSAFFTAESPDALPPLDGAERIAVPQGFVPSAFLQRLASRLRLAPEALRDVLGGGLALVDGALRSRETLTPEVFEAHTGVAAVRRAGLTEWVLDSLPFFTDPPMAYDLVQRWLVRAQTRRARLIELDAFESLIAWEERQAAESLDVMAELARGGAMRWRDYVDRGGEAPTCVVLRRGWSPFVDDLRSEPTLPQQLALPRANELALVYPHVTLLLTRTTSCAVVTDAFPTWGASLDWAREGALGFGFHVRAERRWLEGPLPDVFPEALPWSVEAFDDHVLATRRNALSPLARWSPAAELRRLTPDARYGVLVRFADPSRRRATHRHLVRLLDGEPVPTRYDRSLHRAAAIAHHGDELSIAVDGQVLREGRRLARYQGLLRVEPPASPPRAVAAFDETGTCFAWVSADAERLHWRDATGKTLELPLAPLRGPLAPFDGLGLPKRAEAALLAELGAAPLMAEDGASLEEALSHLDEEREASTRRLEELKEALRHVRSWPTLVARGHDGASA